MRDLICNEMSRRVCLVSDYYSGVHRGDLPPLSLLDPKTEVGTNWVAL